MLLNDSRLLDIVAQKAFSRLPVFFKISEIGAGEGARRADEGIVIFLTLTQTLSRSELLSTK